MLSVRRHMNRLALIAACGNLVVFELFVISWMLDGVTPHRSAWLCLVFGVVGLEMSALDERKGGV